MQTASSLSLLFSHLSPAYFSPSVPNIIVNLFILNSGHVLSPPAGSDPLQLRVSYIFVTASDPLIPHLSKRPVVLYDAEWVFECVSRRKVLGLGEWIVPSMAIRTPRYDSAETLEGRQSGRSRSSGQEEQILTPLIPRHRLGASGHQQEHRERTPKKSKILAPRLLLDFDHNTTTDLQRGDAKGVIANLAMIRPIDTQHLPIRTDRANPSSTILIARNDYMDYVKQSRPTTSTPPSHCTSNPAGNQGHEKNRRNIWKKRDRACQDERFPRTEGAPEPPRYMLDEVIAMLDQVNGVLEDVEVVKGEDWRVKTLR